MKNDTIIEKKDNFNNFYLIEQGKVEFDQGSRLLVFEANNYFNTGSFANHDINQHVKVTAKLPTTLWRLTENDFQQISKQNAELKSFFEKLV